MTRTIDPFDELTALFLTEPDAPSGRQVHTGAAPVELLLVGHLPVRAGLWLGPYADSLGREAGQVALVRLDMDEPTIEILRGPADSTDPKSPPAPLRQRIDDLVGAVRVWIVRPPEQVAHADIVSCGADRITILSGGDEAAIVGAYKLLKDLTDAADRLTRPAPTSSVVLVPAPAPAPAPAPGNGNEDELQRSPLPPIGLAVMGCERSQAAGVVDRLNRTASTFLGFDLALAGCVPQMDAGVRSTAHFKCTDQPTPGLRDVMNWISEARAAAQLRPPKPARQPSAEPARQVRSPFVRQVQAEPVRPAHVEPERAAAPAAAQPPPPVPPPPPVSTPAPAPAVARIPPASPAPARHTPVKMPPKTPVDLEPKTPIAPLEPSAAGAPVSLAAQIDGLSPLPVRCPHHESIELAVDHSGRLHVIGWEQSLRELWNVESWAKAHHELIAMACKGFWFDPAGKVVRHIFTARPASVADLHGSDLRLHVLAPVRVGNQTAWYAAPLNADVL